MIKNGLFCCLVVVLFVMFVGVVFFSIVIGFYVSGVFNYEIGFILMLFVYFIFGLCGIFFWVWLLMCIGKYKVWMCILLMFFVFYLFYFLLGEGDFYWMLFIVVLIGFGGGVLIVLFNLMLVDVIDFDKMCFGEDWVVWFFVVFLFFMKIVFLIGFWLVLSILVWIGYDV